MGSFRQQILRDLKRFDSEKPIDDFWANVNPATKPKLRNPTRIKDPRTYFLGNRAQRRYIKIVERRLHSTGRKKGIPGRKKRKK